MTEVRHLYDRTALHLQLGPAHEQHPARRKEIKDNKRLGLSAGPCAFVGMTSAANRVRSSMGGPAQALHLGSFSRLEIADFDSKVCIEQSYRLFFGSHASRAGIRQHPVQRCGQPRRIPCRLQYNISKVTEQTILI
jgi:hypothetical protein